MRSPGRFLRSVFSKIASLAREVRKSQLSGWHQGERIDQLVLTDGDCVNLAPKVALRFASIPLTKKFLPI